VVAYLIRSTTIDSKAIVSVLTKALDKRFVVTPKIKLIINTDRGTQFSSQSYKNLTERFQEYFLPSMSRENTLSSLVCRVRVESRICLRDLIKNSSNFKESKTPVLFWS
jgi:hypothetical protein